MNAYGFLTEGENKAALALKHAVRALVSERLKGFYLFGSKARGDYEPDSDIDIAILVDRLSVAEKREIISLAADIELEHLVVLSPLIFSMDAFQGIKERERRIGADIEREGIPL
jgi:uncharacterized protein